jgi:phosphoribosylcarboxyaminoimidazole (NCAIR) mutase
MILPTLSASEWIVEKFPDVRHWIARSKEADLIFIGIAGEAAYVLPGILESLKAKPALLAGSAPRQRKPQVYTVITAAGTPREAPSALGLSSQSRKNSI